MIGGRLVDRSSWFLYKKEDIVFCEIKIMGLLDKGRVVFCAVAWHLMVFLVEGLSLCAHLRKVFLKNLVELLCFLLTYSHYLCTTI